MPVLIIPQRPPELLTTTELRQRLRAAADAVGGFRAWAQRHQISEKLVYAFCSRPGPCPPVIAEALGFAAVVRYVAREVRA